MDPSSSSSLQTVVKTPRCSVCIYRPRTLRRTSALQQVGTACLHLTKCALGWNSKRGFHKVCVSSDLRLFGSPHLSSSAIWTPAILGAWCGELQSETALTFLCDFDCNFDIWACVQVRFQRKTSENTNHRLTSLDFKDFIRISDAYKNYEIKKVEFPSSYLQHEEKIWFMFCVNCPII